MDLGITLIIGFLAMLFVGTFVYMFQLRAQKKILETDNENLTQSNNKLQEDNRNLQDKCTQLSTETQWLNRQQKEQLDYFAEAKNQMRLEFQNLAQSLLESKSQNLQESTQKGISALLTPLQERIQFFEKRVEDSYTQESRERFSLQNEIQKLVQTSQNLGHETQSLVRALKSESKLQGMWGELVLERILESAGLREGEEFVREMVLDSGDNSLMRNRPDVVIRLADGKHLIVDAKVSLTSFERLQSAADDKEKDLALKEHTNSIQRHFKELSSRHYTKAKGVSSPEFVFMFIPLEGAFAEAIKLDPELWNRAWREQVAIVTPLTLLPCLKTVANIWQLQKQKQNALEIADEAARIYDKIVGFLEDFDKVGKQLDMAKASFDLSNNKLRTGNGNALRRLEKLRELGAMPTKRLPELSD